MPFDRRHFLLALALIGLCGPAFASDGDSSGSGSGGDGGGGSSGSGSSGGGSGSSNSGSGSNGSGNTGSGKDKDDAEEDDDEADEDDAQRAVRGGEIIPLAQAMSILRESNSGRVIDVRLQRTPKRDIYAFKLKSGAGRVTTVKMDARNGRIMDF